MARRTIAARIPEEWYGRLQELAESTEITLSDVVTEAIALYLGENVRPMGDRLSRLEKEVAELRGKFRLLGN